MTTRKAMLQDNLYVIYFYVQVGIQN